MKNHFDKKKGKNKCLVKKYDIHACQLCPNIEKVSPYMWLCGASNKYLGPKAIDENRIPDWCSLEDYES